MNHAHWKQVLVLAALLLPSTLNAATVRGTLGSDYRNSPYVGAFLDREFVILSARGMLATGRVDSLLAAGVKPLLIIQPNQAWRSTGTAIGATPGDDRTFPWDTATYRLALEHDAILRDSNGLYIDMFGGTSWAPSMLLDFRNRKFGTEYAALLVRMFPKIAGVVLDYGCPWIPVPIPQPDEWRAGWIDFLYALRNENSKLFLVSQCDQWKTDLPVDGVLLERVGATLNPPRKTWDTAAAAFPAGPRIFLRQERSDPAGSIAQTRRFFASLALLRDGVFGQLGDPNTALPAYVRDPEHFELKIGYAASPSRERWPGVWYQTFSRGAVVINLGPTSFVYSTSATKRYTIAPFDGLIVQTRDALGRYMTPITNSGR